MVLMLSRHVAKKNIIGLPSSSPIKRDRICDQPVTRELSAFVQWTPRDDMVSAIEGPPSALNIDGSATA